MQVARIVEKYLQRFQDEEERLKPLQDLLATSGETEILSRNTVPGHITASGFVVSVCRTRVLRLQHRKLKRLLQPGGHIQAEDVTPLDAAKREIVEETGLNSLEHIPYHADVIVPVDIDIHLIGKTESLPAHSHHDFRYIFLCKDESEFQLNTAEFEGFEWSPISSLMKERTYKRLKPKIEQALSNEFRSKLFFDQIAEKTTVSTPCQTIVVGHVVPDAKVFFRAINEKAPLAAIIPKPKSCDAKVKSELLKQFHVVDLNREVIEQHPEKVLSQVASNGLPVILFDIGGYFAPVVRVLKQQLGDRLLGIVEDTENGVQRYEKLSDLRVPVVSVARSPLKDNEDFLVGQSILYSADTVLREVGLNVEYMTCAVLGYGKIGSSIAHHLLSRGIKPWVYDSNPLRRISAKNRMCLIPDREEIVRRADVLFCATGQKALRPEDFEKVKPGCVVCSVTSNDDELELPNANQFTTEKVSKHVTKHGSFRHYFYLVNDGNAANFVHKPALGSFIHLVRAEMLFAVSGLTAGGFHHGVNELGREDQQLIAELWLKSFADSPPANTDLSVAGIL